MSKLNVSAAVVFMLWSGSAACAELDVSLDVPENKIPSHGIVVGDLVLANKGDEPICLINGLSYFNNSLSVTIVGPDGSVRRIGGFDFDMPLIAEVGIASGGEVRHPICLMSDDDDFLFGQEGRYEIRAHLRNESDCSTDGRYVPDRIFNINIVSNPVIIEVTAPARGMDAFLAVYGQLPIWKAFSGITIARSGNSDLGAYERERSKLALYLNGAQFVRNQLASGKAADSSAMMEARENLSLARECGIAIPMWEWIVARMEALPRNERGVDDGKHTLDYRF